MFHTQLGEEYHYISSNPNKEWKSISLKNPKVILLRHKDSLLDRGLVKPKHTREKLMFRTKPITHRGNQIHTYTLGQIFVLHSNEATKQILFSYGPENSDHKFESQKEYI
jgi:hypothetical protein